MRRICCFCESWESGGIESFLNNVLLHMDISDMEVDIVAACVKESIFTMRLESKGIRFIGLSGKLRSIENYLLFRRLVRERKYDVIHFNLFQGLSLYYVQIAKEEGVPIRIAHSHNTALRKSKGRTLKLLLHQICSKLFTDAATELWACSQSAAEFLFPKKCLEQKRVRFIPNGIETERFKFDTAQRYIMRNKLGLSDAFVIGNAGRFCYQKNQDFLLDVFVEVLKRRPESRLLLIGEGEYEAYLKDKAKQLGISGKVIFYGLVDRMELLLWTMDIFAFPSLFEGLGIVSVEAQAAGVPVISSEGIPEEAQITPLIKTVSLKIGPQRWAEEILKWMPAITQENGALMVREAGFDILEVSNLIRSKYRESRDGTA